MCNKSPAAYNDEQGNLLFCHDDRLCTAYLYLFTRLYLFSHLLLTTTSINRLLNHLQ